jgi:undecaprenyl-diphosphatase
MSEEASTALPSGPETVHSPTDALRFVIAALITITTVLVVLLFPDMYGGIGTDISAVLETRSGTPSTIVGLILTGITLAVPAILLVILTRERRLRRIGIVVGAAVLAALIAAATNAWLGSLLAELIATAETGTVVVARTFFYPYVAPLPAAIAAAAPSISRRSDRVLWVILGLLVGIRLSFGTNLPAELVLALSIGAASGAGVLYLAGSPSRRPTGDEIIATLARSGIVLRDLSAADVDARGSTPYFGEDTNGRRLFIKTLSTDERSADLLFHLYRTLRFKNIGDEPAFSTLRRAVEHEALLSYSASSAGVRTPPLVAVGVIGDEEYSMLLAYEAISGRSLDEADPGDLTGTVLRELWNQVATLRAHGIAHRDLRLANVLLDDAGHPWIIDFGFSELAAADLLLDNDIAELVVSSALLVGPERAVRSAVDVLGADAVARSARRVQPLALSGATRQAIDDRGDGLDVAVRSEIARVTGRPIPDPDNLRRLAIFARFRNRS